jgi:type I site-specific restriction-modification system R (restriction) subunit
MPPHPGWRYEQADEALAGKRDLHRLHRYAAAAQGQGEAERATIFGTYIHTYKFHEAVVDKVILDLKYEARDVPQRLTSPKAIDAWFEQKTKGLNNFQRAVLRNAGRRWRS